MIQKLLSLLFVLLALNMGCAPRFMTKVSSPEFRAMQTNRYELLVDAYIYEELQDKSKLRFLGFPIVARGIGCRRFPSNPADWIGKRYGTVKIVAAVPQGTEFRVTEHHISRNPTMGTMHYPTIVLDGLLGATWGPLHGFWLVEQLTEHLQFHPEVVGEKR